MTKDAKTISEQISEAVDKVNQEMSNQLEAFLLFHASLRDTHALIEFKREITQQEGIKQLRQMVALVPIVFAQNCVHVTKKDVATFPYTILAVDLYKETNTNA